jgi:toxin FitB
MLRYLLDTCVVSDLAKDRPTASVVEWTNAQDIGDFALSVLTIGEIRRGAELLQPGRRRELLLNWLENDVLNRPGDRILKIDERIAQTWGVLTASATRSNRLLPIIDGMLLATAHVHGLTVVTRNVRDLAGYDVPVVNPWDTTRE